MKMRRLPRAGALALAAAAMVAAVGCRPTQAFYEAPDPVPATPGEVVRTVEVLFDKAAAVHGTAVLYSSTSATGDANVVSGTVYTPKAPWAGPGSRPVVAFAPGTQGMGDRCAPSQTMPIGKYYELGAVRALLDRGWAVAVTDYEKMGTAGDPTYMVKDAEAHALLDLVRAAQKVPETGVAADSPVGLWGYSQGGQAAAWAGELQPAYAPDLALTGVAAGGIPADLAETARYRDGGTGATFELMAIVGLATQYPELPIDAILTPEGREAFAALRTQCVFEALPTLRNRRLGDFTTGGLGLEQLLALGPVAAVVDAQRVGTAPIEVPLYTYHGQADEIVPLEQAYDAKLRYCELGVETTFDLFPSEHITTQFQAAPQALAFIADRFAGAPAEGDCDLTTPPASTAPPKGGDFEVALDAWGLGGTMRLATLAQDVTLPDGATFSATTNLTTEVLAGDLSVPDFDTPITFLGFLPLTARVGLEPAGTTGTVALGTDGSLTVEGTATATIVVKQVSFLGLPLTGAACRTTTPVEFPLSFHGPVSALGTGDLTFEGTATIPPLTGCEGDFIGAFVGPLMSGPGNTFAFTVAPPAPTEA